MVKFLHLLISSSSQTFSILTLPKQLSPQSPSRYRTISFSQHKTSFTPATATMSIHAFAGNPLRSNSADTCSPELAFVTLKARILESTAANHHRHSPDIKVLPFKNGRPLASSAPASSDDSLPRWQLGWLDLENLRVLLGSGAYAELSGDSFVYLGSSTEDDAVYWAIDVSGETGLVLELGNIKFCFVELRTLMVATDWVDFRAMGNLAIAGNARALLEWHHTSRFCGHCGEKTVPMDAGRRKQCSHEPCKKRMYPRIDPVVIMLVIDQENDRALLCKQSRFVPRMWSCLAGFIEPGESLEEAVRRETWEETGIEVGKVVYHSSQPWPVGASSMPCQLMVGFLAYAKSLEITVDKQELQDARWYSREDVSKALTFAEYKKAQRTAAAKVEQLCKGVERTHSLATDFNVESGELAPMFVPGPFAIAHHLISTWAFPDQNVDGLEHHLKELSRSMQICRTEKFAYSCIWRRVTDGVDRIFTYVFGFFFSMLNSCFMHKPVRIVEYPHQFAYSFSFLF